MAPTATKIRRIAGQSLRDEKEWLSDTFLIPFYFSMVLSWILWGWELYKAKTHSPPHLTIHFSVAIAVTGVTAIVYRRLYLRFRNLNRGERGELKVAETLDDLRAAGYHILHDIPSSTHNIDHAVVGPAGVFVIETKYRSGYGEIEFRDGEGLFIGGRKEENDALKQARSNARDVSRMLKEHCGRFFWVTPLVVFVGDWKVKDNWQTTDARVFTTDTVLRYFNRQQPMLTRSEIQLITSHLDRSVKA